MTTKEKTTIKSNILLRTKNLPGLISSIIAQEILDSRGYPTIACTITTIEGYIGKAKVPSGASTGEREAIELRDGDKTRYFGKGVLKAVSNVNDIIAKELINNFSVNEQEKIDNLMIKLDGTQNKAKLGANAILSVSLAICDAAAKLNKLPLYKYISVNILKNKSNKYFLPVPMLNVINGGAHADNTIDFQEFMFMPVGAKTFADACRIASECFHQLAKNLKKDGFNTSKGDEGGFAPLLSSAEEALTYMVTAIKDAGYVADRKNVAIALDVAASELYEEGKYVFAKAINVNKKTPGEGMNRKTTNQMISYISSLAKKFPIISVEDGLAENDWKGWQFLNKSLGNSLQIVGDDLYCTNPKIVEKGIKEKATNSVLIKLNQIGTLTETIETIKKAHKAGWTCVVSHRSGETEDTFIADLTVALNTKQIKTGSMSRSERIAKYNRLLEIEKELGKNGKYAGSSAFNIKI